MTRTCDNGRGLASTRDINTEAGWNRDICTILVELYLHTGPASQKGKTRESESGVLD